MYVFYFSIHLCCSPDPGATNSEFLRILYPIRLFFRKKTLAKYVTKNDLFHDKFVKIQDL